MWQALRNRWKGPITKIGVILTALAFVPKWVEVGKFWYEVSHWVWLRVAWLSTGWGRASLVVVGLGLIGLDQRRIRKPRAHDLRTVKGRTLQLRDDLQLLLNEALAKWPEHIQGKIVEPYNHSIVEDAVSRGTFIQHAFALRFASRAEILYHECALAGAANDSFMLRLHPAVANASKLRELIDDLDWMANHVD